jgi:hypothetical protein
MAQNSRGFLFRKRTILGAVLAAGIGLGVYLGPKFKGFFPVLGTSTGTSTTNEKSSNHNESNTQANAEAPEEPSTPIQVPDVVKVVIDDRKFILRNVSGDQPITLPNLIQLIKKAPGDADGVRVRIYEKSTARTSAEEELKAALVEGGIHENSIFWVPPSMKD